MLFRSILPLAICFDARDIEFDKAEGLSTIPIRFGIDRLPKIYFQIISAFVILSVVQFGFLPAFRPGVLVAMIASGYITYRMIVNTHPRRHDLYYVVAVDGMMYAQFILVWLMNAAISFEYLIIK